MKHRDLFIKEYKTRRGLHVAGRNLDLPMIREDHAVAHCRSKLAGT